MSGGFFYTMEYKLKVYTSVINYIMTDVSFQMDVVMHKATKKPVITQIYMDCIYSTTQQRGYVTKAR